jgi:hypothetical protein
MVHSAKLGAYTTVAVVWYIHLTLCACSNIAIVLSMQLKFGAFTTVAVVWYIHLTLCACSTIAVLWYIQLKWVPTLL